MISISRVVGTLTFVSLMFLLFASPIACGGSGVPEAETGLPAYDAANIPDFYLNNHRILGTLSYGSDVFVLLISFDDNKESFIFEIAIYPSFAFEEEIRRYPGIEEASKWRPSNQYIPYLAWSPFGRSRGEDAAIYLYQRNDAEELIYIASDIIETKLIHGDDAELGQALIELFETHIQDP